MNNAIVIDIAFLYLCNFMIYNFIYYFYISRKHIK